MAHGDEVMTAVRDSYVNGLLNITLSARKHDVPESTARRWKLDAKAAGDCWDLARAAARKATGPAGEFTEMFIQEFSLEVSSALEALKEKGDDMPLAERAKVLKQLKDMYTSVIDLAGGDKKIGKLAVAATVIKEFGQYITHHHSEHTETFVKIIDGFGPYIARKLEE
ncbi:hypothetical protein JF50_13365 [Pseudoalteromonas luteoviolacea]|uniref:Uncharacterized protein n=1 Tax=Pseudoalteromonas luteoviolacea TaxID=43657 RepID=A0A0C1MQH4_9GAMM|nr:DUF1804 family protein [Pseudoalteromonas luteoviolacea]KID56878.1 hypothetical protein JF50_13365 [Pseudoalteromonas luteoviolacea]